LVGKGGGGKKGGEKVGRGKPPKQTGKRWDWGKKKYGGNSKKKKKIPQGGENTNPGREVKKTKPTEITARLV